MQYVKMNKEADNDWFTIESNKSGTRCVSIVAWREAVAWRMWLFVVVLYPIADTNGWYQMRVAATQMDGQVLVVLQRSALRVRPRVRGIRPPYTELTLVLHLILKCIAPLAWYQMQIPATYPVSNPELCIPELEGKTSKMYRCGHGLLSCLQLIRKYQQVKYQKTHALYVVLQRRQDLLDDPLRAALAEERASLRHRARARPRRTFCSSSIDI